MELELELELELQPTRWVLFPRHVSEIKHTVDEMEDADISV